jgi:hypothetical protein
MSKTCETCKYWEKPNPRYYEHREVRKCTKAVQLFDAEDWVEDSKGDTVLGILPEYKDQMMFTQDGSSYAASLYTRGKFFCAHWEKEND